VCCAVSVPFLWQTIKNISASNSSGGFQCTHCQYSVDWVSSSSIHFFRVHFILTLDPPNCFDMLSYSDAPPGILHPCCWSAGRGPGVLLHCVGTPNCQKAVGRWYVDHPLGLSHDVAPHCCNLANAVNGRQTNPVQIKRRRIISAEGASSGVSTDSQDPFMLRRGSDLSQAFLLDDVVGGDAVDADDESSTPRTSHCSVLRLVRVQYVWLPRSFLPNSAAASFVAHCWCAYPRRFTTIVFNTIASQCLVGLIPYLECDEVKDLDTLLMYAVFYPCAPQGFCFTLTTGLAPSYHLDTCTTDALLWVLLFASFPQ